MIRWLKRQRSNCAAIAERAKREWGYGLLFAVEAILLCRRTLRDKAYRRKASRPLYVKLSPRMHREQRVHP
jgi:hypothetical protein